jgi:hypothetical protein
MSAWHLLKLGLAYLTTCYKITTLQILLFFFLQQRNTNLPQIQETQTAVMVPVPARSKKNGKNQQVVKLALKYSNKW